MINHLWRSVRFLASTDQTNVSQMFHLSKKLAPPCKVSDCWRSGFIYNKWIWLRKVRDSFLMVSQSLSRADNHHTKLVPQRTDILVTITVMFNSVIVRFGSATQQDRHRLQEDN
uniref:Uncharacterized protein n=1 Tax=Micrurus corallinus TaxID=54390 RepID=A0A2D4FDJ4_MICCO